MQRPTWDQVERARILIAGLAVVGCSAAPAAQQAKPVPVTAEIARRGDQPITSTGLGHMQGFYTADARAQTGGRITSVSFVEGQAVRAGQPLAQIDRRPLEAALSIAQAQLARDASALSGARDLLSRAAPLVSQGLASAQQVNADRVQVDQLEATVAGDRAAITRDRLSLAYATVRAPISGVTGLRKVDPGAIITPSDQGGIVTIAQVQPIALLFTVPQKDLVAIQGAVVASSRRLSVAALPQDSGLVLDTGELVVLSNQIDSSTGTITLKAVFPNAARKLWPGQLVRARLSLGIRRNVVTVPSAAIQRSPQATFVWLVANGRAQMRPVQTGSIIGDRTIVSSGLAGDETVVTDGQFALTPGAAVTVQGDSRSTALLRSNDPRRIGLVQ